MKHDDEIKTKEIPTLEFRWYKRPLSNAVLQQKYTIIKYSRLTGNYTDSYYEWKDVPLVIEK